MTRINQRIPKGNDERYIESDTALLELEVTKEDGSVKDLTDAEIIFTLSAYAGSDPLISKDSSNNGVRIVDPVNGKIKIYIEDETAGLGGSTGEKYHYEIKVKDGLGDVSTVTNGKWTIYSSSETF